jgi:hypothetical protein
LKIPLNKGKIYIENGGPLTWKALGFVQKDEILCLPSEGWEKRWDNFNSLKFMRIKDIPKKLISVIF